MPFSSGADVKKKLPTFTTAPPEMLPENLIAFKIRMAQLDIDHARARSPGARHRIEDKMRELRKELRNLEVLEAQLDWAARAWWKGVMKHLDEVIGPAPKDAS